MKGPFYPEFSDRLRQIAAELKGREVAILGHMRPDGDCIGSQVALCRVFRALGIEAVCVNADVVPRRLTFLLDGTPFYRAEEFDGSGYIAISVDCADRVRTGEELERMFPTFFANIDHHISNKMEAKHNLVESGSAATAEVLTGIFLDNDWLIDPVTAQALYVGIATDTGQFRFPSTTRQVFALAGHLIDKGADPAASSHELYERETLGKMRLLENFLASLRLEENGRICIGFLPQSIFTETGTTTEDTEGLVDYARSIGGVDIAGVLEEQDGVTKGSLRCKDPPYRVDQVAQKFQGGGHACAAGFSVNRTFDDLYPSLLKEFRSHLEVVDRARSQS